MEEISSDITQTAAPQPPKKTIQEKELEVQKQKRIFDIVLLYTKVAVVVSIVLGVFSAGIYFFTNQNNTKFITIPETPQNTVQTPPVKKKLIYKNDELKISFEYSNEANVLENASAQTEDIRKTEIYYSPILEEMEKVKESSATPDTILTEGYIFGVTQFKAVSRKIDELAAVKKEAMISQCPATSDVSAIISETVDTIEARSFEIRNCGADYVYTYVPRFFSYYEFVQISRGDIGVKQQNKLTTEEIIRTVKFYPEEDMEGTAPAGNYQTYKNDNYKFAFRHQNWDDTCCDISGPASKEPIKLVVLAETSSVKSKSEFNGIGIFIDTYEKTVGFDKYLAAQAQKLKDDYVVVKGNNPDTKETTVSVGDKSGYKLSGFSWKGNDLIYVNLPVGKVLVISVETASDPKAFNLLLDELLGSFVFFK